MSKLTEGVLTKVEHFDSKAEVGRYAMEKKGSMIVSKYMPGYFMSNLVTQVKKGEDDTIALSLPWDAEKTWVPLCDIRADLGKWVAGLFAAGQSADGVEVQGVSQWVHPKEITDLVGKLSGKEVKFVQTPMTVESAAKMPRIPEELMQNMMLLRDYSYFGKGAEGRQGESDKWLAEGMGVTSWEEFAMGQKWEY